MIKQIIFHYLTTTVYRKELPDFNMCHSFKNILNCHLLTIPITRHYVPPNTNMDGKLSENRLVSSQEIL